MKGRILIVDDNPSDLLLAKTLAESAEFIVETCDNGFDAIEKAKELKFSLIVVDLQMPKMNGLQLAKNFGSLDETKDTPILVMSSRREASDVKRAIQIGVSDYIVKPIDHQIFKEKLLKLSVNEVDLWFEYDVPSDLTNNNVIVEEFATVTKLSEVGFTIISNRPYEVGEVGSFKVALIAEKVPDSLSGKIQSCKKLNADNEKYEVGVSLVGVTDKVREEIRRFCWNLWKDQKDAS